MTAVGVGVAQGQPVPDIPVAYRIVGRFEDAVDVVTLRVRPVRGDLPPFRPAQFSMIGVVGFGEVPISITSRCDDTSAHAYTIRRSGAVTNALWERSTGDVITVRGPFGRAWDLDRAAGRHAMFVAGGIGIAPLRAAIDELTFHRSTDQRITVLAGAGTPSQHLFEPWMRRLLDEGVEVRRAVDGVGGHLSWSGHVGLVTDLIPEMIGESAAPGAVAAYVCGPDRMMSATVRALARVGVSASDVELTLERTMQCANGWCGHCQIGPLLVCRDGPVVRAADLGDLLSKAEL